CRDKHSVPVVEVRILVAGLKRRRQVGQGRRASGRTDRKRHQLLVLDKRQTGRDTDENEIDRPVITSVSASGPPRNGTCVALNPALTMKRPAAQWVALPTPAEAKLMLPSFAFATSSCRVLIPFDGAIRSTFGTLPKLATAEKSPAAS